MDQTVLEHLCEAYLFWALYTTDFIALLQVSEEHAEEFGEKLWKRYEDRHKENERTGGCDYEQGGKDYAKYLIELVRQWEGK